MKKNFHSVACAATIATTMLLQIFAPSVVLAMDTTETTEPSTVIETTASSETSETSQTSMESVSDVVISESSEIAQTDYIEETTELTETEVTVVTEEEVISSETNTDPTDNTIVETVESTIVTEETTETSETEEIEYIMFDHYYSEINASLVSTSELFVITSDPSVFTRNTNVVSNYDDAFIIECASVEEARFVYSYYVDKVDFITDMSDVVSVATDDVDETTPVVDETEGADSEETAEVSETTIPEETVVETEPTTAETTAETTTVEPTPVEQEPDLADLSALNNGSDAIANLNGIDTVHNDYSGYIALIDTGANAHANFTVLGGDTFDYNGHGTSMYGYIRSENPSAQVVSIKVSENGSASAADIYAGFRLAIDLNVSVINFSMTAPNIAKNAVIRDIIQEALDAGIVVIGAAGNNSISATNFIPGCIDGVITIGAVDVDGNKIRSSNYNADYYVVADSTSEATARYTGLYTAGLADISIKVFDQVVEDDDYVPDDYLWAYDVAEELTNRLQAENGYGYVTFEVDEDGNVWFVYHYETEDGFIVTDWPVADATINLDHDVSYTVSGTSFSGTCDFTSTDGGKGYATNFSGTLGGWLAAAGISQVTFICSKNFGYEDSNHAKTLPTGTMNYVATYQEGQWTIWIGQRAQAGQPVWTEVTDTVSYSVSSGGGGRYLYVTVGGTTRTVDLQTQSASQVVTEVQSLVYNMTVVGEYNGNKGCRVTVPSTGAGTHSATRTYWHTDDTQTYEAQITWPTDTPHAAIYIRKVDAVSGAGLAGCTITLTGTFDGTPEVRNAQSALYNNGVLTIVTGTGTVEIRNLAVNSNFTFTETGAPIDSSTGLPYDIASPISATFSTNANGDIVNVSASGDWSFASGTATFTLKNGHTTNPNFSSIGVLKVWPANATNNFWQDTQFLLFAIQFRGSWETYQQYGWGDSWSYGRIRNPDRNAGQAYVGWLTTRESAIAHGGMSLYYGDNQYIPGRYFQHIGPDGRMVDNEGASYDWNRDLLYLPYGYYHITEYWQEAYISAEGQREFSASANASGWTLEAGGPGTGSCQYGIIIKIDGNGTWICDSNGNPVRSISVADGVRLESVANDTLEAALDVRKIDLTGGGINGASFELYNSNNARIATGSIASTPSGTTTDAYGNTVNYYDVSWDYTYNQAYRTDDSAWHYQEHQLTNEPIVQHLNYTTYQIREYITDMRGYRVPEGWEGMDADGDGVYEYFYKNVTMSADYHNEPLTVDCANRQYRLRVTANKVDQWSGQIITNYGGSYEATFELYVDLNENGAIDSSDTLIATLSDTDRDGVVLFDYLLDDLFPNVTNPADYPSHYLVREVTAPFDYYLNPTTFNITANDTVGYNSTVDVSDTPYTAQIHMFKLDGDTSDVIRNAQFTIYNDVDGNKVYTEGVDTVAQTWNETDGLHDAQCVWNARLGCYLSSPLRSGNYVVVETGLPSGYFYVDGNGQPTLARNEVYFEIVGKDVSQVSSENPLEDVYEGTVYNLSPSIQTTFHDPVTMSQTAHVDDDIELIDTVSYTNLVPNVEVRLDAVVMVKSTEQPLLDANGNQVTGYRVFTPSTANGTIDVSIHLDTNYVMSLVEDGTLEAPVDLVCFETLSFTATTDVTPYHQWYDENPIAEHKEIGDLGQTVRVAEVHTGVYDNQTLSQVASDGPNGDGYAVIVDHVHYEGLAPGHTYTMRGEMHLLTYDEDGNAVDGGVLEGADARENLHPTTTFTPTDHEGYVDVTYTINVNRFRGQTTVSYEYCEENGRTIVFHEDIEDLPQTLFIPDVHTNAYCPDTTPGDMGRTVIGLQQRARIVDEVTYENLLVDGRQYMIQGCLYWMYTDENGTIHSGPMADIIGEAQATSTIFFTPTEQDGTIEMLFTFDSTVLADLHYDRLVVCESIFANGGIGWKRIANHWDFSYENNSQSIYVPDVHTTASTAVGQTLPEGQNPDIMPVTVSDRVFYENLIPGTEYTVVGNLQYAITDENGNITESGPLVQNGVEVKAQQTFVPTSSSGYVDLEFTVNAADIMAHGYDRLIAFEEVYVGPGVLVAHHADITDEDQTVEVPDMHTTALGANGRHSVQATANTEIIDTVAYTGLTPGREYRLETDLMSTKTGGSIAHVTTTFVPTTPDGVVTVSMTADLTGYGAGDKVVVFENCYDNSTGILIKSHMDWDDENQTVETGGGGDTGVMDSSGKGYLVAAAGCVVTMIGLGVSEIIKKRKKNNEVASDNDVNE